MSHLQTTDSSSLISVNSHDEFTVSLPSFVVGGMREGASLPHAVCHCSTRHPHSFQRGSVAARMCANSLSDTSFG